MLELLNGDHNFGFLNTDEVKVPTAFIAKRAEIALLSISSINGFESE